MFESDSKHRGESREVIRRSHVLLGASALMNVILIIGISDSTSDTLETKQAAHDITNYLHDDGYENVRNLTIDYIDNTFSFTISDNTDLLGCIGRYEYENGKAESVGHLACENIKLQSNPSESPLPV